MVRYVEASGNVQTLVNLRKHTQRAAEAGQAVIEWRGQGVGRREERRLLRPQHPHLSHMGTIYHILASHCHIQAQGCRVFLFFPRRSVILLFYVNSHVFKY